MSKPRKPRGSTRFPKREVTRITEAVRVAGGGTVTLEPETGHYRIVVASKGAAPPDTTTRGSDLDHWIAKRGKDAHQAEGH
jgi:hypothetical protein